MRGAHLPRLREDGQIELAAVADPAAEQAEALMDVWGSRVPRYADYRKLVRTESLDAVVVNSPHWMHYEQARYAQRPEVGGRGGFQEFLLHHSALCSLLPTNASTTNTASFRKRGQWCELDLAS